MMTVFLVRAVRFIRMRKQIQGRKTAVNGRVINDIQSDLSDQEIEGCLCYAIQNIWGAHHYELINHPAYEPFRI
jgi:hypothetical protein